jgi:plastocyanin
MTTRHGPGVRVIARTRAAALVAGLALAAAFAVGCLGCAREPGRRKTLHEVVIRQLRYEPEALKATVGDTVQWLNRDLVPHTATEAGGRWDSGSIPPDGSWRTVLRTARRERYGCLFHPNMQARLEVR